VTAKEVQRDVRFETFKPVTFYVSRIEDGLFDHSVGFSASGRDYP